MSGVAQQDGGVVWRAVKTLLVAVIVGPLIAAAVFMLCLLVASGDVPGSIKAAGTRHLSGIFEVVLMVSYFLIVPHILFLGLIAAIIHMFRRRVDSVAVWGQAQWAFLIYVCTMTTTVNGGDIRFAHRLMFLFSLFMAWAGVWLLTRRWHARPVGAAAAPGPRLEQR